MLMTTIAYFQVSADNMRMYIVDPALLRTKLRMLQDELDRGYKSVYPEAMEATVCFEKDIIKEYMENIALSIMASIGHRGSWREG